MAKMTADQIKKSFAKARSAQAAGDFAAAIKGYERVLRAAPQLAEVHFNLGEIYARLGKAAEAAQSFEAALKLRPGEAAIWAAYLDLASRHPRIENLVALLKRVGNGLDHLPEIDFFRGLVAARKGTGDAVTLFQKAISAGSKSARLRIELGMQLERAGQSEDALQAFDEALALDPKNDFALARKSGLLRNVGRLDEALDCAQSAIAAAPKTGAHYYAYASVQKIAAGDPMIGRMQSVLRGLKSTDRSVPPLGHALAKAMADTGETEKVFPYLAKVRDYAKRAYPYDAGPDRETITKIQKTYETMPDWQGDRGAPVPLFVTGMPRSGTTLIEQILSSHSKVSGGGELGWLSDGLMAGLGLDDPTPVFEEAAKTYRARLADRFADAPYVTDKSISSYAMIGFIRAALPDARILVVRRDPRDTALSIYRNFFEEGTHRYSNDLADIARFMRIFEAQIAYWSEKTPEAFIEVRYEDVIADLETHGRRIVDHAGLDWEEACLNFHENTRKVDTLSTTQVRQPLYASSVSGWKRYEAEMQPFIEEYLALGGTL